MNKNKLIERDTISALKKMYFVNGLSIGFYQSVVILLFISIFIAALSYTFYFSFIFSLILLVLNIFIPIIVLHIRSINQREKMKKDTIEFIGVLRDRSISISNVNILFDESVKNFPTKSLIYKHIESVNKKNLMKTSTLQEGLSSLAKMTDNGHLMTLVSVIERHKEDGTDLKTLLNNTVSILREEQKVDVDMEAQNIKHFKMFLIFCAAYIFCMFGMRIFYPEMFILMRSGMDSVLMNMSLFLLISNGVILYVLSKR